MVGLDAYHSSTEVMIEHSKAFEVVGEEYGLTHQKQPEGYVQDHHDMWLEKAGDQYMSFIDCSEKIVLVKSNETHLFRTVHN